MSIKVDDQRAIPVTTVPCPLIDPNMRSYGLYWFGRLNHSAQQSISAGLDTGGYCGPLPSFATGD
ncbi:hypothetical protein YKD1_07770 [Yersinia pseudotuberculosis]